MKSRKNKVKLLSAAVLMGALGALAWGSVWALQPKGDKSKKAKKATQKDSGQQEDCKIPEKDRKAVLAKVGKAVITVGSFADEINKKSPYLRARYATMEKRKDLLKSMVRRELLAAEAEKRGFSKDPDVQRSMKQVMIQKMLNKVFEDRIKKVGIPEEEMKKFYQDHFKEYNKPEQVRVSHIVVKDKATADKVLGEAQKKGRNMRVWRQLVRKHTIDKKTKVRGGDLRYFPKDTKKVDPAIVAAAFKMEKPGSIGGPIKTKMGFHIVRLTHRRKAFKRTFEEVKDQIKQRILRRKRSQVIKDFVKELRNKAKINVKDDELKTLKVDTRTPIRSRRRGMRYRPPNMRRRRGGRGRRRRRGGRRRRGLRGRRRRMRGKTGPR